MSILCRKGRPGEFEIKMKQASDAEAEELALVNPLCRECRHFFKRGVPNYPFVQVGCLMMGDPKGEGTECVRFVSKNSGCENCVNSFLCGTMIGGRQILGCKIGHGAFNGGICDDYRRRSEEDE